MHGGRASALRFKASRFTIITTEQKKILLSKCYSSIRSHSFSSKLANSVSLLEFWIKTRHKRVVLYGKNTEMKNIFLGKNFNAVFRQSLEMFVFNRPFLDEIVPLKK